VNFREDIMQQTLFQHHSVYQLANGDSICHISPENGARLLDWKISERPVVHWPEDADWNNVAHARGGNPILFPFLGRHMVDGKIGFWKDETGKVRELPMHGFARDMPFQVIDSSASHLQMRLRANDATRAMYPFEFEFDVIYELGKASLKSTFITRNIGENVFPYYAGHHFYLEIPHTERAAWNITLPCEKWGWQNFEDGSIRTETAQSTQTTLADKAIIDRFHLDFIEPKVLLESPEKRVTFSWANSDPWFDVTTWTQSETADFYCVEPWLGLPNAIHHGMGLRVLAAGEKETASCEITVAKTFTD
jgi:galactose mutarotase-like enzyme